MLSPLCVLDRENLKTPVAQFSENYSRLDLVRSVAFLFYSQNMQLLAAFLARPTKPGMGSGSSNQKGMRHEEPS